MNIKNNSKLVGWAVLIAFIVVILFNKNRIKHDQVEITNNRAVAIAITNGCEKNVRSSLYILNYRFVFNGNVFIGTTNFSRDKRGDICNNVKFLVDFDSLNPSNNKLYLDSIK